ncbi:MAG TPA: hypothetical protein VGM07_13515 [Stellaceae bacterium]|jgi:hypothetical protein
MRRWTLAAAAAALFAAALWHLPAIAQRAAMPAPAAPAAAAAQASAVPVAAAAAARPATPPAAAAATVAPELITFEEYRDFRVRYIEQSRARLSRELAASDLSAAQKASLERRKAYYDRQAAMPASERDPLFRARFDLIDTDHDGTLDSAERAAWRAKQRAHYRELATERAEPSTAQH